MAHTAGMSHKDYVRQQVTGSIGQICDAWPDAIAAAESIGFPTGQGGRSGIGGHGDPTANKAMNPDAAIDWMRRARILLVLILRCSAGSGRGNRWMGPFNPKVMRTTLMGAGGDLVELWPVRVQRVFAHLYDLADEALREWPPTPAKGTVIDGVKVLERTRVGDECAGCGKYVAGDANDPIRRLDGKPYHERPCYEKMRKRRQRAAS